jgi:tetratricopeptide (TPR) repeat protein
MASRRYEDAIPIYRQLVQAAPGNPGLLLNLALAEHMAGHERESIPHFEAVLKSQPHLLPALVSLAAARLSLDQPELAVTPLRTALGVDPKNVDARGMLADALNSAGHFEQAADEYRKLTEAAPDDARAWYGLGVSYQSMARNAFDRLQKIDPQSAWVLALVADTRVQRRQYRSAFLFYREALKRLPDLHGLHAALAEVYRKTGHADWAATEDSKEQQLAPADCRAHPAECAFVAGHDLDAASLPARREPSAEALYWRARAANELALQAFSRLGELPASVEMHELKAQIARDQDQHLESVKEWRAALELAPGDAHLHEELATSLFLAADYRAALEEASKLLAAGVNSSTLNFTAGNSLLQLEEPDKAVPHLQRALALDAGMMPAQAALGLALARSGKNAEAIPHLQRALPFDDDGNLHYQLARALQSTGQAARAAEVMAEYQRIVKKNEEGKQQVAQEAQITAP